MYIYSLPIIQKWPAERLDPYKEINLHIVLLSSYRSNFIRFLKSHIVQQPWIYHNNRNLFIIVSWIILEYRRTNYVCYMYIIKCIVFTMCESQLIKLLTKYLTFMYLHLSCQKRIGHNSVWKFRFWFLFQIKRIFGW